MKKKGLTILELILAIAIIAVLAGGARLIMPSRPRIEKEIAQIKSNLRQAQRYAMSQKEEFPYYGLKFYAGLENNRSGYKLLRYSSGDNGLSPDDTIVKSPLETDFPLFSDRNMVFAAPVRISEESDFKPGENEDSWEAIIFDSYGSAYNEDKTLLSEIHEDKNYATFALTDGTQTAKIKIYGVTGYIEDDY